VEGDGPLCVGVGWNIEGRRLGEQPDSTIVVLLLGKSKGDRCEGNVTGPALVETGDRCSGVGRARTSKDKGGHIWRRRDWVTE
jgi:hypothetical protein